MAFGSKGAIGAALGAAGKGVQAYGERTYREQLNERIEAARQKREDSIRRRSEEFTLKRDVQSQADALERIAATAGYQAKAAETKLKNTPPKATKRQNYELTEEKTGKKLVAQYDYDKNVYVPTGDPEAKPIPPEELKKFKISLMRSEGMTDAEYKSIKDLSKDYNKEYKILQENADIVAKAKTMLKNPNAYDTKLINNQLANLFAGNSRAASEVKRLENVGTLPQRFLGFSKNFFTGRKLESQVKEALDTINQYETNVLQKQKDNVDSYYTDRALRQKVEPDSVLRKLVTELPEGWKFGQEDEKEPEPASNKYSREDIISAAKSVGWSQEELDRTLKAAGMELYSLDKEPTPGTPQRFNR